MTKLSDADFDKVVADLKTTTIGSVLVKDYVPIKTVVKDADGKDTDDGDPTEENAFVISCEQRGDGPSKLAYTKIDIRGPDGLVHTSYERDHVDYEPVDDTTVGKTLFADVYVNTPSTQPGAGPNEYESVLLLAKDTVLSKADVGLLQGRRIVKVPTKLLTADEISAVLKPFLELDHEIAGSTLTANQLGALGAVSKTMVDSRTARTVKP